MSGEVKKCKNSYDCDKILSKDEGMCANFYGCNRFIEDSSRKCKNSFICRHNFKQLEDGRCLKFNDCNDYEEEPERCNYTKSVCWRKTIKGDKVCDTCVEFINYGTVIVKNNLESLDKQQEKKVKQQLKREKRVEEKVEKKIEENIKEKTSIKIEDVKIIVDTDSKKFDIVQAEISQKQSVKREVKAVKIEQPLAEDKKVIKKKFGILSWLKNWLFR